MGTYPRPSEVLMRTRPVEVNAGAHSMAPPVERRAPAIRAATERKAPSMAATTRSGYSSSAARSLSMSFESANRRTRPSTTAATPPTTNVCQSERNTSL